MFPTPVFLSNLSSEKELKESKASAGVDNADGEDRNSLSSLGDQGTKYFFNCSIDVLLLFSLFFFLVKTAN